MLQPPAPDFYRVSEIEKAYRGAPMTFTERKPLERIALDRPPSPALDGLSIGFRTARAHADKAAGVRRILEADLWEISLVTFPMLPGARVERTLTCAEKPDGSSGR